MTVEVAPVPKPMAGSGSQKSKAFVDKDKPAEVRASNIVAGKAVADAIRTSLGPKGMDKMASYWLIDWLM